MRTRTGSSTSRSAPRSTRRPRSCSRRCGTAADAPGYPLTVGREDTRQACLDWLGTHGVDHLGLDQVLPVIGTKELVGSLAVHLGIGPGDTVVFPELAYPTYAVGAALAGARAVASDGLTSLGPETPALVWLNSPSNPTGRVLPVEHLRKVVDWCRERGSLLVSDECYLECAWDAEPVSVLHPDVCGGSAEGILAVHSLSKRSNLAGYRCGFVAGDRSLVAELLAVRKNLGLMMPAPQQVAMAAALRDTEHAERPARDLPRPPRRSCTTRSTGAGFRIDHSEASLYLWATPRRGLLGHRVVAGGARDPGRARRVLRRRRRAARAGRAHRDRRAGRGRRGASARLTAVRRR